jgi:hypothetical protein
MRAFQVNQLIQFEKEKGLWQTAVVDAIIPPDSIRVFWWSKGHMKGLLILSFFILIVQLKCKKNNLRALVVK